MEDVQISISYPIHFSHELGHTKIKVIDFVIEQAHQLNNVITYGFAKLYFGYKYKEFRQKYNYSQLKKVHQLLLEAIQSIEQCAECKKVHTDWFSLKMKALYKKMVDMLERKKKQEELFFAELKESMQQADSLITSNKYKNPELIQLLEHELQSR